MNGKIHEKSDVDLSSDILNPFVHRLELATTYDKIKTGLFTVAVLPFRVAAIIVLLVLAWLLACVGLFGLSDDDLRNKPMTGWRKDVRNLVAGLMRLLFAAGSFHWVSVKGRQATVRDAPILTVAPHSSYFDALPVVCLGAPSVVAKGESSNLPFFGIAYFKKLIRRKIRLAICRIGTWSYAAGGMTITIRGRQASRSEAPILVVAPHSTFLDAGIVYVTGYPSIIVRRESGNNPWLGKLINLTQPVYVWREDSNSRQRSIREIIARATSPHDWPQVLIFPEGTCTNRSCLITFKPGAFYPGVPVQPVCIRYPNKTDTVTWTWEGPGALKLLWLTLTQPHSNCEIEFLPVYRPSEEEKRDPKLFANNVRNVMAKALGIPVSDFTYNDCRLISLVKQMKVPRSTCLLEVQQLRAKLGLIHKEVEERLSQTTSTSTRARWPTLTLAEFAASLQVPVDDPAVGIMFNLYADDGTGVIDFREYLMGVLAVEHNCAPADALRVAWQVYDSSGTGKLSVGDFVDALHAAMAISGEDAHEAFRTLDATGRGYVTFAELEAYAKRRPEFAHVFPTSAAASSSAAAAGASKEPTVPCARLDTTKEKTL